MRNPAHWEDMEKSGANIVRDGTITKPQRKLCGDWRENAHPQDGISFALVHCDTELKVK